MSRSSVSIRTSRSLTPPVSLGLPMSNSCDPIGCTPDELDTPYLRLDLDRMESNIRSVAGACRTAGKAWRPHAKGHKNATIAKQDTIISMFIQHGQQAVPALQQSIAVLDDATASAAHVDQFMQFKVE